MIIFLSHYKFIFGETVCKCLNNAQHVRKISSKSYLKMHFNFIQRSEKTTVPFGSGCKLWQYFIASKISSIRFSSWGVYQISVIRGSSSEHTTWKKKKLICNYNFDIEFRLFQLLTVVFEPSHVPSSSSSSSMSPSCAIRSSLPLACTRPLPCDGG